MSVCGATTARCSCILPPHDDRVHVCACEGSWEMVNGVVEVRAVPRINMETGGEFEGYDPDPETAVANLRRLEAERLIRQGVDPWMASLLAGPPIRAQRGRITYRMPGESMEDYMARRDG